MRMKMKMTERAPEFWVARVTVVGKCAAVTHPDTLYLPWLQVPALLLLPASTLGPSSLGGTPVDNVLNMCATYEWYTSQWLMAAAKERQPQQMTSFASMHS